MPGSLDSCISSIYEPGNIPASSGEPPVRVVLPPDIPLDYDPDEIEEYSLDYTKLYNSQYLILLLV
jgi:hypothetical protein